MKLKKLLFILLTASFLVSACQENPDDDIVVNKGGNLSDQIETASGKDMEGAGAETFVKNEVFTAADQNVEIRMDISYTPELHGSLSVYRGVPRSISVDEVKLWSKALFKDSTPYEPTTVKTKSELSEEILNFKQMISNREKLIEEYGSEQDADNYIEYINGLISALEQDYASAPESYNRKETDWTFHPYSYYDLYSTFNQDFDQYANEDLSQELQIEADVDGHHGYIWAINRDASDYTMHCLNSGFYDEMDIRNESPGTSLSPEDADKIVYPLIAELGFEGWLLDMCFADSGEGASDSPPEEDKEYSKFTYSFTPALDGLPVFYTILGTIKSDDAYAARYYYENMQVNLVNGKVIGVSWYSPLEITETVSENVKLLSMDEIYERFKSQLQSEYTMTKLLGEDDAARLNSAYVKVTDMTLYMMRIREKGTDNFLLVPAYGFKGDVYIEDDQLYFPDIDLTMINAIDGSTINVELGY